VRGEGNNQAEREVSEGCTERSKEKVFKHVDAGGENHRRDERGKGAVKVSKGGGSQFYGRRALGDADEDGASTHYRKTLFEGERREDVKFSKIKTKKGSHNSATDPFIKGPRQKGTALEIHTTGGGLLANRGRKKYHIGVNL